jgi:hypothetical protein
MKSNLLLACSFATFSWFIYTTSIAIAEAPAKVAIGKKIAMTPPETWEVVPPKSQMIQNEFKAPKDKEDSARITVMAASGGVAANIDRWIGQFEGANKENVKQEDFEAAGAKVHLVDISGTYKDSMGGGPFAPGPVKKRENYRMMGAIVETANEGTIFIKMTGPQATVEELADGFREALKNLKSN